MAALKIKTGELRNIVEVLGILMVDPQTGEPKKWPVRFSYWLTRMVGKTKADYDASEKMRISLAEELGTKTEDGSQYLFESEAAAQFQTRLQQLYDTEIEVDLPLVSIDSLADREIEPGLLLILEKFLVDSPATAPGTDWK